MNNDELCYQAFPRLELPTHIVLNRLRNAIKEALCEMGKCPDDSVQDIWNESFRTWQTGLRMDHHFNVNRDEQVTFR
jgi:hypothetical protein